MGEHAIESHPAFFVRVESLIEKVAQKAPVLRDAFPIDAGCGNKRAGIVLGIGGEVAYRSETQSSNNRVADHVDVFVNPAGLKASVEMDMAVAGNEFAVNRVREPPLRPGDYCSSGFAGIPHRQLVSWVIRVGDGVFGAAEVADHKMSERNFLHHLRRHQVAAQQPTDRLSLVPGDRSVQTQCALAGSIPLPSKRHHAVAVAQQPSVSGVRRSVPVTPVDQADDASPPAVRNLQQQGTVAPAGLLGSQGHEVSGKLDRTVVQVHCLVEIDDAPVVQICDRYRKEDASGELLIGARIAKCLAARNLLPRGNINANYPGVEQRESEDQKTEPRNPTHWPHGRKDSRSNATLQLLPAESPPPVVALSQDQDAPWKFGPDTDCRPSFGIPLVKVHVHKFRG